MDRALEDDLFDAARWTQLRDRAGRAAALEDVYPKPLKRDLLAVLDAAIAVVRARPERLARSGMVETCDGGQSFDVALPDIRRVSIVGLLERIIVYRHVLEDQNRYFYAGALKHVMHAWLYKLAFELCDADTRRISAAYRIGDPLDWQNVIRPDPAEVTDFLVRVRGRLSRTDALSLMRGALGEAFEAPLRPSDADRAIDHVYRPPQRGD